MKKKLIASITCLSMLLVMLLSSTMAWFTDQKGAQSTMVVGKISIKQNAPTKGQTAVLPNVSVPYQVTVENTGNQPAYLRTIFAFEDGDIDGTHSALEMIDLWKKVSETESKAANIVIPGMAPNSGNKIQFTATEDGKPTVYTVGFYLHEEPLEVGQDVTIMDSFMLDSLAGNDWHKAVGEKYDILVLSQACQVAGMEGTYEDALNTSFGTITSVKCASWFGDMMQANTEAKIATAEELQEAINNGQTDIVLENNIELTDSIVIPAPVAASAMRSANSPVVLDLNGKTISNPYGYVVENYGNVVITGKGTLTGLGGIRSRGGSVVIENGNFYASSRWQDGVYQHTLKAENSVVTINGGNFDATVNGHTNAMLNASENAVITINGGSFKNVAGELTAFDPYIFTYEKNGAVEINDGTFYGGWRFNGETATTTINGGTFSLTTDGQSFNAQSTHVLTIYSGTFTFGQTATETAVLNCVVDGYKAVLADGSYYVVADNVAGVVTNPETLKDALSAAGAAGAGNTTIAFFGNIDMSGTAWTPIKVDGYHGADIVTIEGNGATITGLTAPLFAGGFAGGSGIVIKDLTIARSNIVSTNTIGSGAFIESVDSMALITLDNCHLVNSTVTGGSGSRTGGLIGWTAGYNNVNDGPVKTYVNITNCSVIDCTITCDGSVGGIYGHAGNNAWTYSTIENCTVKNCKLNSTDDGGWRVGVVVGTANVGEVTISNITESGNTLTQTGKTAPAGQSNLYGRFVPGTTGKLVIDGAYVLSAATQEALDNAINAGETEIALPAGNYSMPGTNGDVTISGTKDTVIDLGKTGANNVTFNGITVKSTGYYGGLIDSDTIVYNNCTIDGPIYLYGEKVVFNNCTFAFEDNNDYLWVYAVKNVEFNNCTFNTMGKAILVFQDGSSVAQTVKVEGCTFNASAPAYNWNQTIHISAVSIDGSQGGTYNIILNNNTVDADFNGLWQDKTSAGNITVTVDGATVLNP